MRRIQLSWLAGSLTLCICAFIAVGCGGSRNSDEDDYDVAPSKRAAKKSSGSAGVALKPVKAKEYGILKGKVVWEGAEPTFEEETEKLKAAMSGSQDKDYCLTGKKSPGDKSTMLPCETEQQTFRIGKNKGLGNVFVWIQPESGHYFDIPKEQLDAVAKEVTLAQPHCSFMPHCLVLFPSHKGPDGKQVPTGQKFLIENDARVGHNAKVMGGPLNSGQGSTIPARKEDGATTKLPINLRPDTQPVSVACDIHGWMKAWVRVYDHPYATVTSIGGDPRKCEDPASPNYGTFEIKGVPVGAKVKLYAWHEVLGYLGDSKGKEITLKTDHEESFTAKLK